MVEPGGELSPGVIEDADNLQLCPRCQGHEELGPFQQFAVGVCPLCKGNGYVELDRVCLCGRPAYVTVEGVDVCGAEMCRKKAEREVPKHLTRTDDIDWTAFG